jgi:hypothetical protein
MPDVMWGAASIAVTYKHRFRTRPIAEVAGKTSDKAHAKQLSSAMAPLCQTACCFHSSLRN